MKVTGCRCTEIMPIIPSPTRSAISRASARCHPNSGRAEVAGASDDGAEGEIANESNEDRQEKAGDDETRCLGTPQELGEPDRDRRQGRQEVEDVLDAVLAEGERVEGQVGADEPGDDPEGEPVAVAPGAVQGPGET